MKNIRGKNWKSHKLLRNLKSQITIFMVLGLVIVIIFGLVYFVRNASSEKVLEKKINKIYGEFLGATGIQEYIAACLDTTTKSAIRLAALQGGKIYDYQVDDGYVLASGEDAIPFNYSGVLYNVSYGIRAPVLGPFPNLDVPDYPYPGDLVKDPFNEKSSIYSMVFAQRIADLQNPYTLTALCNYYGPNYYGIDRAEFTCETKTLTNESVQEYLKIFIFNRTRQCVNFDQFSEDFGHNVTDSEIEGFVLLGNDDVFVNIKYPIKISFKGSPPITKYMEFKTRPKVRLKKLHELASHLIGWFGRGNKPKTDANNVFFNITLNDSNDCFNDVEFRDNPCILEGMNVSKFKDYCTGKDFCSYLPAHFKYSDVINVTDYKSIIDGAPLTFLFAVENRVPALNNSAGTVLMAGATHTYIGQISANINDVLTFFVLDPDEDELTYSLTNSDGSSNGNFQDRSGDPGFGEGQFEVVGGSGTQNLLITVSDNEGLSDYQEVDVILP